MALNPWLEQQLAEKGGSMLNLIVEVPESKLGYARNILKPLGKLGVVSTIAGTVFIPIRIDSSKVPLIEALGTVHYDMPTGISLTTRNGKSPLKKFDKFLGEVYIPHTEVPTTPMRFILDSAKTAASNISIVPSGKTVDAIKDTPASKSLTGRGVKLGVIDTGFVYGMTHPMMMFRKPELYSTVPEPPVDGQAHGSWCTFMAGGSAWNHPKFGELKGVAENADLVHVKALTTMGFGSTQSVLKAMEIADRTGCKVVSMSLGGPSQGGVDDDPETRALKMLSEKGMIFVVAAGNDGVDWSIGSPATSPYAITVGSQGFGDNELSSFSSRGPQSEWYKDNPEAYERDLAVYGDDFIKPDVVSYGGQINEAANSEEVILTGGVGWFAPFYHKLPDMCSAMHGTSQATPCVAGMIACMIENGMIRSAKDFKNMLSTVPKNPYDGYGLATFSRMGRDSNEVYEEEQLWEEQPDEPNNGVGNNTGIDTHSR
ncbi:MAG: S8 family serine peptidase [Gammaproteobacteria bacterium]|nr:S8 family serine peptidase [Gammaproteobacteria bacterium]